jgi:hypothetical protein
MCARLLSGADWTLGGWAALIGRSALSHYWLLGDRGSSVQRTTSVYRSWPKALLLELLELRAESVPRYAWSKRSGSTMHVTTAAHVRYK